MGCTYLAVLTTALAMQALGGGGIDGMIQRLGRPEGHDGVFAEFVAEPSLPAMQHLPAGTPALLLSLFSAVALAPIAEELFFRGFIYANVRTRGVLIPPTITAGLFAFMYVGDSPALPASMLPCALIAALARERYGSVRPSIYLHAVWNLVAWGEA